MPMIDISASNLSKASLYIDVLHNRADNFQDRLEFVARASDSVSSLIDGNYVREIWNSASSRTEPSLAQTLGVSVGGAFAAAHFQDITVTNPTDSGMEVTGQTASTLDGFDVTGGGLWCPRWQLRHPAHSILITSHLMVKVLQEFTMHKDITGTLSGNVVNSAGAAFKYGPNSNNDISFSSLSIGSNAVGVETAGSGDITLTDVTMANTKDIVIKSAANVETLSKEQ